MLVPLHFPEDFSIFGYFDSYARIADEHEPEWSIEKPDPFLHCRIVGCHRPPRWWVFICNFCGMLRCVWRLGVKEFQSGD